jgi:hypothetical protein
MWPLSLDRASRTRIQRLLRLMRLGALWNEPPASPFEPDNPVDPDNPVRAPRSHGPSGRIAAAAVEEPEGEPIRVEAHMAAVARCAPSRRV